MPVTSRQKPAGRGQQEAEAAHCRLPTADCLLPTAYCERGGPRRGQVILEFVIACFGLVMFIYVLLQSWVWLTGTIVRRQASFQHSRLDAGKRATAGKKVPYRPGRDTPARFNLF